MQWVRDTGGTNDGTGAYHEAFARFTLLDGVVGGPAELPPTYLPITPLLGPLFSSPFLGLAILPDGTARFPWNGFAGEGISTVTTTDSGGTTHHVTGPGGTCSFTDVAAPFPTSRTKAVIPSPDGTKLAVFSRLDDSENNSMTTSLTIYDLGASCTRVAGVSYSWRPFTGEQILSPLFVWSATSSAVLFNLVGPDLSNSENRLMRLDATPAATPSQVLATPGSATIPLGWSAGGRILFDRSSRSTATPPVGTLSLETMPDAGGHTKVFDVLPSTTPTTRPDSHVGYFVPGTSLVLYRGGTRTATSSDNRVVAWPQFRIFDDTTNADAPLGGVDSPLTWHQTPSGEMPNAEFIEKFIH